MQSWRNTLLNSGDKRKLAVFTALTLLWMIVIFLFSAQPSEESYKTSDLVLAFGLLALLYFAVLKSGGDAFFKRKTKINHYLISLMGASLYAFTDELHQFFVPGRNATVLDWLFDSLGALAVLWIVHTISAKIKKRNQQEEFSLEKRTKI